MFARYIAAVTFILAAGLGSRLRPLTNHRPKPLLPVCGVPMLDQALALARQHGHEHVLVNAHHLWEQVAAWCETRGASLQVELPEILADVHLEIDYGMLLLNALTAFALNLAVFLLIGKTSALTMNIAGVIKDWILIFASQHIFGNTVTFLNYLGYVIAFLAVGMYNYDKLKAAKRKEAAA